jgi:hypothetical protein
MTENIVRLTPDQIVTLAERLTAAMDKGRSVRICTGQWMNYKTGNIEPGFKYDAGDSVGWSPALFGLEF